MKKIVYTLCICGLLSSGMTSCTDYLDVSKELQENIDLEKIFTTPMYVKSWYAQAYATIPRYSQQGYGASNGFHGGSWGVLAGEMTCMAGSMLTWSTSSYNSQNAPYQRWTSCYQSIRQGMIFLERVPESLGSPDDQSYLSPDEINRMRSDIEYLIAYNYFLLFELYGPVPIITEIADPDNQTLDYARSSVDEVVNYIDGLLQKILNDDYLPESYIVDSNKPETDAGRYNLTEMLRPTQAAVLALRARLWVYAASPLFNGGYAEALQTTNKDGKRLFPDKDPNKWNIAKQRLEDLLTFADNHNMKLYHSADKDPNKSVYELFQYYNDEILWADGNNDYNSVANASDMECRTTPRDIFDRTGNVALYQEIIDSYFTKNGLTIEEDTEYNEEGFTDWANPCNNEQHVDKNIFNMFVNREPRFYAHVTYEGKSWHIQPNNTTKKDYGFHCSLGGGADNRANHPISGYLMYKFNNRSLLNYGSNLKRFGRPWILFRLADFYLYYAEVCNEIDSNNPNIIKYLDLVRERAGIPGYKELKDTGKKDIIGDYGKQRDAIRQERRVELMGEGNLYFDTHRWMIAGYTTEQPDNESKIIIRKGLDVGKKAYDFDGQGIPVKFYNQYGEGTFFNRVQLHAFPWNKAMLLYPIPYTEMQKGKLIVQNPLWN